MGTHTETSPSAEAGTSWKEALFNPRVTMEFGVERDFGRDQHNHQKLVEIIEEVDGLFPWKNQSGENCVGIHAVKSEFVEETIDFGPRVLIRFEPYDIQLGRGQFIAYYNYTVNLAKVISMMGIKSVNAVSVKIDLLGVFNFFKSK